MKKAVFLDRDGVINEALVKKGLPTSPDKLHRIKILPGVKDAINMLHKAKFEIVVVTNQPDVARGKLRAEIVAEMNQQLARSLSIQYFYTCFHDDIDACICRKPGNGMLLSAARDLNIDLKLSYLVGDRWKDVVAGQSVGCQCFFIDYGYLEPKPDLPYVRVNSLLDAAISILGDKYVND